MTTHKSRKDLECEIEELRARVRELERKNQVAGVENIPSARLVKAVMEHSAHMFAAIDRNYIYRFANHAYVHYRGFTPDQVVGRHVVEIVGEEAFFKVFKNRLDECFQGREVEFTASLVYPNQGERVMRVRYFPLEDEHRSIVGATAIATDITSQRDQEIALRETEDRWQFALDSAGDGLWDLDLENQRGYYSHRLKTMLGYPTDDPLFTGVDVWKRITHPDDLGNLTRAIEDFQQGHGDFFNSEIRMRAFDGSYRWILSRGKALSRDPDGKPLRIIGTHKDSTERKQLAQALFESEQRLHYAFEGAGDGIWELDNENGQNFYSDQARRMLGYTANDLNNEPYQWRALIHPDDLEQNDHDIEAYISGKTVAYQSQFRMRCNDGTYRWILSRGKMIKRSPEGKPLRIIGTHTDITQQKLLEKALRESEEILRLVTDNMTDMVSLHALDGTLLFITPSVKLLTGFTIDQVLSKNPFDFIDQEDARTIVRPAFLSAVNERVSTTITYRAYLNDHTHIWVESILRPIMGPDGNVAYLQSATRDITSRKTAEEMFQKAFQTSPVGMIISGSGDRLISDANHAALNLLEVDRDQILTMSAFDFVTGDQEKIYQDILAIIDNKGSYRNLEISLRTGKGRDIDGLLSRDTIELNGQPHFMYSFIDITERNRLERLSRENEKRLREAQRIGKIGSWELDLANDGLYWSDEIYRIFEVEREEFPTLLNSFDSRIHPDDEESQKAAIRQALNTHEPYNHIHRLLMPDGRIKIIHERAETLYDSENGAPLQTLGTAQDITDWVEAQNRLEESQRETALFKTLVEATPEAVSICLPDGSFEFVNSAHEKLFGDNLATSRTKTIFDYLPPESILRVKNEIDIAINQKGSWTGINYVIDSRKRLFPVWQQIGVIPDDQGQVRYIYSILHEDTLRIQAEEELRAARDQAQAANRTKSEFLAMISHEIRTPMNSIQGFTHLLEQNLNDPRLRGYLAKIQSSGETLISLINDILEISKIEAGRLSVQKRPVLLRQLIDEIVNMFSLRVMEKNLTFISTFDPHIPGELELDDLRLRQVLFNLVGNAIKYTEKGHVVLSVRQLAVRQNEIDLAISVEDNGPGISLEDQEHIFDVFGVKAGHDRNRAGSTGLGLAISSRLVGLMGGTISVKSNEGSGSIFEVILPSVVIAPFSRPEFTALAGSIYPDSSVEKKDYVNGTPKNQEPTGVEIDNHQAAHPLPKALRIQLETHFLPRWQQFRELQPVDSMHHFGIELALLGEQYASPRVIDYANNLLAAIDMFDIEEIDRLLALFPNLLQISKPTRRRRTI